MSSKASSLWNLMLLNRSFLLKYSLFLYYYRIGSVNLNFKLMSVRTKPSLLATSAKTDVTRFNGEFAITGLSKSIRLVDLLSVEHRLYTAEVVQVINVGVGTPPTITASTRYTVQIGYPYQDGSTGQQSSLQAFSHTTPATLSGVAATDRENVYAALITKINAGNNPFVVAATLGGGTGMTITDVAGYNAARPNAPREISSVLLSPDPDGGGFTDSVHREVGTAGVVGFGEGTRLAADDLVIDPVTNNVSQGEFDAPDGAVAGQQYDAFFITSYKRANVSLIVGENTVLVDRQVVFVDNGAGTSTANAAGYAAFRTEMEKIIYIDQYGDDPNAIVSQLDVPVSIASKTVAGTGLPAVTGVATGVTGDENSLNIGGIILEQHILGAGQTKIMPTWATAGLTLDLDAADDEGAEYSAPIEAASPLEFVVGTEECSFFVEVTIADVSDTDDCAFGFRKKEAYQANLDDYDEMACLNVISGDINIETILNGAATTTTDTTDNFADTETHTLEVRVDINGAVTYLIDDAAPTTTAAFSFDAGEVLIPFAYVLNAAASAPGVVVSKWYSIAEVLNR